MIETATPTLDAYFAAALTLARLVRQSFDQPRTVKRDRIMEALVEFERLDWEAMG